MARGSAGGAQGRKRTTAAPPGRERSRLRGALVVAELALAVVLLAGAGLLIKSFWRLQQVDAGFTADHVLKAEYQLPTSRYPVDFKRWPDFKEMHAFNGALLRRAEALPGVDSVAIAGNHPLDPGFTNSFVVPGREAEAKNWPEISVRRVTPGYFRTVGLHARSRPPASRRRHDERRRRSCSSTKRPRSASFGDRSDRHADRLLGRAARSGRRRREREIPGDRSGAAAGDVLPLSQAPSANGAGVLLVRAAGDPLALASAAQGAIREVDGALAIFAVEPLTDTLSRSVGERRFTMLLLALFAVVALVLAAVGVHGVLSYGVTQRTREIGIRMALGAQPSGVSRLVVSQGMTLALSGTALGVAAAFFLTRSMGTLLFGVTPTDPFTFVVVPLGLALVALVASYLPARRATRVDPVTALRAD